jgi:hypothetical protein
MGQKLTLIVTCTDRKSVVPPAELLVRNLPPGSSDERSATWIERLRNAQKTVPLHRLYQGESWSQAMRLEASARAAGFTPELIVASAGLGLMSTSDSAPAYGATFSSRQPDSVAASPSLARSWWTTVSARREARRFQEMTEGATILVLSASYASAMATDLKSLSGRADVVVFGGSQEVPEDVRIPADRQLRPALGGTATSLNLRTARAWIDRLPSACIEEHRDHQAWRDWASSTRRPDVHDRKPVSDAEVIDFVQASLATTEGITYTRALRHLREAGMACEQKRFKRIFHETGPASD